MIVQCPDCASRFRLADDKLKSDGTKVRCSRCQKIFTVMPRHDSPPIADDGSEGWNEADGSGGAGFHEFDFGQTPSSGEFDSNDEFHSASDFDFDAFGSDQDQESEDFFADTGEDSKDFAFGEPASFEDGSEFSMGEDDEEDFFSTSARMPAEDPAAGDSSESFGFSSAMAADKDSLHTQKSIPEELNGFDEELFGSVDSGEDNLGRLPPPVRVAVPRKSGHKGAWLLSLLFLGALAAGGYFVWKSGSVDLAGLLDVSRIQTLLDQDATEIPDGQILTRGLNGYFLQNRKAGRLFVIQGEAVNDYREPRSAIAVKGVIFDGKGAPLLQQTVFCGNPIETPELTSASFDRILERMNNQFGDSLSNLNVPAGKAIPFTIVFRNLPAELSEFSVEVVDSKSASR
jgi:predicted Zn finger-like uncharacterized protein